MFKRRQKLTPLQTLGRFVWPRRGWGRTVQYMRHRLNRLPDTPEKIARGVFCGVLSVFTPLFGLHFFVAYFLAKIMRANVLAALLATFVGNPVTYVPIAVISLKTGHLLLGRHMHPGIDRSVAELFFDAAEDLWRNVFALFTDTDANFQGLERFFSDVFYPYLIGGILPGLLFATIAYALTLPVIRAYQQRRRGKLKAKIDELARKAGAKKLAAKRAEEGVVKPAPEDRP
ncbi:DUF2062 domain-containing protein [Aquimixticola soesokkakensis]|uniref:DUF2062 domain-containing protein n=1 Tax=Aquimixticola soesokkakensis TaxID=1519096 RepID=UPI00228571D1|nr:DUF2062 domain-containing protein [Aquimixticola soesokkakensis]